MKFELENFSKSTPAEISGLSLAVERKEGIVRDLIKARASEEGISDLRFFLFSKKAYATWWNSREETITAKVRKRNRRFVIGKLLEPITLAFIAFAVIIFLIKFQTSLPDKIFTYLVAFSMLLMLFALVIMGLAWRDISRNRKGAPDMRIWHLLNNKAVRTGLAVSDRAIYFAPYSDDACERSALRVGYGDIQSVLLDEKDGNEVVRLVDTSGKSYSVTNPEGPAGENAAILLEIIKTKIPANKVLLNNEEALISG